MFNVIVRNSKGEAVSTTHIAESTCTLGSQPDNQVVLPGWTVAKVHAELVLKEDGIHVANRARLKALRVNDNKVDTFGPLTLGDTIAIGDYHIKVQIKRGGRQQADDDSPQDMEQLHQRVREKVYWAVANALATNTSVLTADEMRAAVHQLIGAAFESFKNVPPGIDRNRLGREVMNEFVGNGPLDKLLQMEDVNEIMVNAPGEIFF